MNLSLRNKTFLIVCIFFFTVWENHFFLKISSSHLEKLVRNATWSLKTGQSDMATIHYTNLNSTGRAHWNETTGRKSYAVRGQLEPDSKKPILAICTATRSQSSWNHIEETALHSLLLPSINTSTDAESRFDLRVYIAIDDDDVFWRSHVGDLSMKFFPWLKLHPLFFPKKKKNRIPFNEMMRRAYEDGAEYLVRVNDDTEFVSKDWIELGVGALAAFKPRNVGVVGPTCHQGNTRIMTHDMVHRTHLQIFPTYYPSVFSTWWIDDWITRVYEPGRSMKIPRWIVHHHTDRHGTRYAVQHHEGSRLDDELQKGRHILKDWIRAHDDTPLRKEIIQQHSEGEINILSYSLYGKDPRYTEGAIENAKLVRVVYPGWTMKVFHDNTVPKTVLDTLTEHGVELVDASRSAIVNQMSWRFIPASNRSISRFCSRDIDARLSLRERAAVDEWVTSKKAFHVMRDHPSHMSYAMSGGMWCATNDAVPDMQERLQLHQMDKSYLQDMNFLNAVIWPIAQKSLIQHDSFSCEKFGGGRPFPTKRQGFEHVGSVYIGGKMREVDVNILKTSIPPCNCTNAEEKINLDHC